MKKKMSFTISSKSVNLLKSQDLRCPKCSLIPFITISTNDNQLFMTTKCINDHIYEKKTIFRNGKSMQIKSIF